MASVLLLSPTLGIVVFDNTSQQAEHQARILRSLAGAGLSFATIESRPLEKSRQSRPDLTEHLNRFSMGCA